MKSHTSTPNPKSKNPTNPGVQGEGDYVSGRKYQEQARAFAESGKVKEAAEKAAPRDQQEQDELLRAEAEGRAHAKGKSGPEKSAERSPQASPDDAGKQRPEGQPPEPEKPGR